MSLEAQMEELALDNLINLLAEALPDKEIMGMRVRSYGRLELFKNRSEIKKWVKENRKQLLQNLIQIAL